MIHRAALIVIKLCTLVAAGICLHDASPAIAGSADIFQSIGPAPGKTPAQHRADIDGYTRALEEDALDQELTSGQRYSALYNRGFLWVVLDRYDIALRDFKTLVEGTDSKIGQMPETSLTYALSLFWHGVCLSATGDREGGLHDIDKAIALRPWNDDWRKIRENVARGQPPKPT